MLEMLRSCSFERSLFDPRLEHELGYVCCELGRRGVPECLYPFGNAD